MKICIECNQEKPIEDFPTAGKKLNKNGEKYRHSYCYLCQREKNRAYHAKNKEHIHKRNRAWRLRSKFGVSAEWYAGKMAQNNGLCEICNKTDGAKALAVDHDHGTGAVRGLLCTNCNTGIGSLDDSIEMLEKAISYLKKYK
jgi:hypothetical protein